MVTAGRLLCLLLLWSAACVAAAAPRLTLHLEHKQTSLGMPLTATLHAVGMAADLTRIDLQPWREQFHVIVSAHSARGAGDEATQTLRLQLYPRRTGTLPVAALVLAGVRTAAARVMVQPPQFAGARLAVQTHISERTPWQREQVLVTIQVRSPDLFFGLETDAAPAIDGFRVIPLPVQRDRVRIGGVEYAVRRLGWALFPLLPGKQTVELPPVRYMANGLARRVFFPPLQHLTVKPLPAYIPPQVPVGAVSAHADTASGSLARVGHLEFWHVTVKGRGVPADWLPALLSGIHSDADLTLFPPLSHSGEQPDTVAGVRGRVRYDIPFKPVSNGWVKLPPLRLHYFDPDTGRLVSTRLAPPRLFALSLPVWLTAVALAVTLAGGVAWLLLPRLAAWLRRRRARRAALAALRTSREPFAVRLALQHLAAAEGWGKPPTLRDWYQLWQARFRPDPQLWELLQKLSQARYGPGPSALPAKFVETLHRRLCRRGGA